MKMFFIVQGEGRGHMTQALAMEQILREAGHTVEGIAIGTCSRRELPGYFRARTQAPVHNIISPNFYFDKADRSINIWKTIVLNMLAIPKYLKELTELHRLIRSVKPDVIINFYDIVGGAYFTLFNPSAKRISIAHQYLAYHEAFPFAQNRILQKRLFQLTNFATSLGSHKRIALSFKSYDHLNHKLGVVPPLLRQEIFEMNPSRGNYILAYVVNKGYAEDLMKWHCKNKRIQIHCFWDNFEEVDEYSPWQGITFHHINDQKFLQMMAGCLGYVSTAGFESVCEAMYLGKPVMMVPVKHQYEQACNAIDAVRAGAGIQSSTFDLGNFLAYLSTAKQDHTHFKNWVDSYKSVLLREITEIAVDQPDILDTDLNGPEWAISNR